MASECSARPSRGVQAVAGGRLVARPQDAARALPPDPLTLVARSVPPRRLFDHLCEHGPMSERDAATLISELAGAIAIMHAQGMCHADIKPENLLLTSDGHVKLVDFGLSCQYDGAKRIDPNVNSSSMGTLAYWA